MKKKSAGSTPAQSVSGKKSKPGKTATPDPPEPLTPAQIRAEQRAASRAKAAENRTIVAQNSSWTGKLPATLLYEHCQKQKWEKVIFDAKQTKSGFVVNTVLGFKNPKTSEIETVRFVTPVDLMPPQETALEARNVAATYALHRIASHKNMRMLLPPFHRDLWTLLDDFKKSELPRNAYKYAENPFIALKEHKAQIVDEQAASQQRKEQREKQSVINNIKSTLREDQRRAASATDNSVEEAPAGDTRRVRFNNVVGMSRSARTTVERTIRKYHGFRMSRTAALQVKVSPSDPDGRRIVSTLVQLGFEKFQAEESLEHASTLSDSLDWLLIHVPEEDLPETFGTRNLGTSANIQSGELKIEYAVREIKKYGYSEELVREILTSYSGDKTKAVVGLTHQLVYGQDAPEQSVEDLNSDLWAEEMESLAAISTKEEFYHDSTLSPDSCTLVIDCGIGKEVKVTFWKSSDYPQSIPGLTLDVVSDTKFPRYVLLDVINQSGRYAVENCLGDFMIMSISEWIKENLLRIRKRPSKLVEIAGGVSGDREILAQSSEKSDKSTQAKRRHALRRPGYSSEKLKECYDQQLKESAALRKMIESRKQLPAWAKAKEIVDLISNNQIVLITGETGSGKSTQVVQFVLDDLIRKNSGADCNIICTQPRRISAMGLAQRVADERDSEIGDQVGYVIRGESKVSANTSLRFVTSGVLLRMIQTDLEGALDHVSHVVVDEVHERSLDGDFLLILLKRICKRKKNLKIILMSATIDPKAFIEYFDNKVGYTHIEGRTFPVEDIFLDQIVQDLNYVPASLAEEGVSPGDVGRIIVALKGGVDNQLVARLVRRIHSDLGRSPGSILIFMSGSAEIDRCIGAITSNEFFVLPLHAGLTPAEQRKVFMSAPSGKRKVVVSTNIAETSITIPDIVAVIDSGRVKETEYDPKSNCVRLVDNWASQAAVTQRRGRAGRVQKGTCYKLYTQNLQYNDMRPRPAPEMARSPLEQLYLSVKAMGVQDVPKFLSEALDPPETAALDAARELLVQTGALERISGVLTPLGKHISTIPADIRTAKLLILSSVFGCLRTGLTIVAILSSRSPFLSPKEKRGESKEAVLRFQEYGYGDLLCAVKAYNTWWDMRDDPFQSPAAVRNWCKDNFLSVQTLRDIQSARRQFLSSLQEIGFISTSNEKALPAYYSNQEGNESLVRAIIGAGLSPNIAEIVFPEKTYKVISSGTVEQDAEAKSIKFFNSTERVFIHPGSTLFGVNKFISDSGYLSYQSQMATSKLFVSGLTPLSTYGMLFFSNSIVVDPMGAGVVAREWLGLKCWPRVGILVRLLRDLFNDLLDAKFSDPAIDITKHDVLSAVEMLIKTDGRGD